jgi:hypothetical protein
MMQSVYAKVLTAGLIMLAASPVFAQGTPRPPGLGSRGAAALMQGPSAVALLWNDKVQEELKITDAQKADLKKAADKVRDRYKDALDRARADVDLKGLQALRKARREDMEQTLLSVLPPEQARRLRQIELQAAGLSAFSRDDVLGSLKLTEQQQKQIKEVSHDFQEDTQDLMKNAHNDLANLGGAFKKMRGLRDEALARIVAGLDDGQKKAWKDLTGDRFVVVLHPAGLTSAAAQSGAAPTQGPTAAALLRNATVQVELQLTDLQKTELLQVRDKARNQYKNALDKAWADMDLKRIAELHKAMRAEREKAEVAVLRPGQAKRLKQIEVQAAGLDAFSRPEVRESLGMNDAQTENVANAITRLQEELKQLVDGDPGDLDKMAAGFKQIQARRTEAFNKTIEGLMDEQYLIWQNLTGRKIELGFVPGGFALPGRAW